jgi:capsular exopolysaccharide synthesis family protein
MPQFESNLESKGAGLDVKRILFLVLKYWYFVVLSLIISVSVAFLINRYTIKIYPVSMTILIKDEPEKDNSIIDLLYNGRGITSGKNYYNEEILLKSFPLIKKTIDSLDFNISVLKEGDIKVSEIYPIPFEIKIDSVNFWRMPGHSYQINVIDAKTFEIKDNLDKNANFQLQSFNKTFRIDGLSFEIKKPKTSLKGDNYYINFLNNDAIARSYTSKLSVSWLQKGASILKLGVSGTTPAKEARFLHQLALTYQHDDLLDKNVTATRTINFIDMQLQSITDSLDNLEKKLQRFKETNYVSGVKDEAVRYYDDLEKLTLDQSLLLIEEKYLEYLDEYLLKNKELDKLTIPATVGVNNTILNTQVQQLILLQLEKNSIIRSSNDTNPFLNEINGRIGDIKNNMVETISSLKGSLKLTLSGLEVKLRKVQNEISKLPSAEREYINLNRLYKLSENLYLILMEKKTEASITKAANTSDIAIVNPPTYGGPITPQPRKNFLLAIFFGLGIPIALVIITDLLNDKVKFKEDIEKYTTIPFMGVIGHNKKNQNLIVEAAPRSAISESFRSVRSNLNFFVSDIPNKVILITSALSGEGKTFFSNNLALILAISGKRTVLIGADMRRPKIFEDFKVRKDIGLSNFLAGDAKIEEIIQSTRFENLSIINSGTAPPNPSELLLKDHTSELIKELKNEFDYIIIDSPPIGLVTDGLILSAYADHTMYVVRQAFTPIATLKNAEELYQSGKFKSLSIVFNDISVNKYGYSYGYSYGYGYGYGNGYGSGYYADESKIKNVWWKKGNLF